MKVAILYYGLLDADGQKQLIGGIETYLLNLAKLIVERGDEPILLQPAAMAFEKQMGHLKVIGVEPNRRRLRRNIRKDLYKAALSLIDKSKDIIIFGADHASVRTDYPRALSIQHGVAWDLPARFLRGRLGKIPFIPDGVCKSYNAYRCYSYFNNCSNRVCVDYNFLNWYRTQVADIPRGNIWVIPNFVDIPTGYQPDMERHHRKPVSIMFARRFVEYRGTRLMLQAAKKLLEMHEDIEFVFAGEGPDLSIITEAFENEARVSIEKYLCDQAIEKHERCHIAAIPSLASEGTSLSLAEAMATGCAVVATNVGGMTNMVIHEYNGYLVNPNVDELISALSTLISDVDMRIKLAKNAMTTARDAFYLNRWKSRWSDVLERLQRI
ncbi:MAG: hypothetical protein CEE38_22190 [Planctomycetes bacterium B3_Pla]|nr:MAG: hypothetical protein CEE38_22190 [Planctomycetes bacterium B3_Pla]